MKTQKKTRIYFYFLLLAAFCCSKITAQPCGALNNFSSNITIGTSQAPNTWYTDRYAPSGFSSPSTDLGISTLKESISMTDGAVNRPSSQQGTFYNTQGRKLDLIAGVQSIEIKLHIPSSWATSNKRMAGLWGTAFNVSNGVSAFPILEFTSDGGTPRFRGYESGSGLWADLGIPAGFTYNNWATLRISLLPSGEFTYTVGNLSYTTTTSHADGSIKIGNAILQGYNYDPTENPVTIANQGVNYDIYWDDFAQSINTDALDHLTIKNANTSYYYCSIQSAINDATTLTGHTIEVASGNYSEQVLVNKGVRILGTGAAKPVINLTGTVSGKPTLFDISVPGVTLENLKMNVDLVKLSSAIIATGTNLDNLTIKNDSINPIGSSAAASFGSYGNRNAVSINYANYRTAVGGVNNISFLNNVITGVANDGFGVARYFRSGVDVDEAGGTFDGNTIQSINQDIQVRFGSNGDINFTNNKINGGGAEVSGSNAGAGNINITGNTFDGTFGNTYSNSLRLKTNSNSKTTVVSGNVFNNHNWGISLESYNAVTIDNNTFTPLANSTTYRHITENTKEISSTSGFAQPIVGGTFTNNTFNGSGTTGGVALIFYNHDNDNPIFQPFNIGTAGNENKFNTGIGTFIKLDNTTGPTGTGTSPNIVAAAGFPEYAGNIAITTMACWSTNLDIVNNKFDVGAGLQLPAAMSITQRAALEPVLFHKPDASCTGILAYYYPVHNITKATVYPTIQSAIDAASANDSIFVEAGIFTEQLSINKSLSFSGAGVGMCGTGGRPTNETHLVAPNSGNLINLSGAVTVNFDGFEMDSANVANIGPGTNQNLGIRNSVFNLNFKPSSTNIFFAGNTLTLECNAFKAISGTNDGSASHIFFLGNAMVADNNSFTSVTAISSLNATTTSLPVWINLTLGANNANINHNNFSKIDIGILVANNAGNIKIWNNEFSEAKRESLPFGSGMGAGIAIFGNLTPIGPVSIRYNKFLNSEDGIRTSGSGTDFPSASLLSIAYNSFESMSDKAIRVAGSYSASANNLSTTCNWFGSITGPTIATNTGASGVQILDGGNKVAYKNWLNYGTDADPSQLGFQLPTALTVVPGANNSQAENHYRVLSNAIGCAVSGQTLTLNGTFDFSNTIAQAEWAKGNNGVADNVGTVTGLGGDDYTITAPDSANNVTLTAASLGSATILSPGDVDTVSLETPLFFDSRSASSSHKKWTISNLIFNGFDVSIMADNNGGNTSVMDTLTIANNRFYIPADWNATARPKDNFQNIGINLNFGKAQTVTNNTFYVDGTGVSDVTGSKYSTSVVLQSTTSGGNVYDGLKTTNNSVHVTGIPNANPARIVGFWENSNNQASAIELSGNTFVNDDPGNLPANNTQLAFRVTSFSGDASHQVVYKNNEITGFNRGISFIGDPFSQYGPNQYFASENPVVIINNKFDKYNVAVSIKKDPSSTNTGSPAIVNNNSFTHVTAGGFAISNESTGATAASCNWYDTLLVGNVIKNTGGGSVVYIPKLSNGNDGDVATGFQLDGTNTCVNPVVNVTQNTNYATIQAAVNAANANDSIFVTEGIYPENVVVNKALKITGKDSALVILDKGDANYLDNIDNIGISVTANNVSLKKMKVRNYGVGVRANAVLSVLALDSMNLVENYNHGLYTILSLDSLVVKNSMLSYNGSKGGTRNGFAARGIFTQSTAADFSRFNIHDNVVERNGLVGIDINLSHSMSGLTIQNNVSRYNFDEQLGVWLGNNNETMGPVLVKGNTLTLSDSAHYGMEVRMPHGTTQEAGNGSVLIQANTITIINPVNSIKDKAALAIIRRKDGYDATVVANDQPQGVVIKDNIISDFQNGATSGSAFGIVVGGIGHRITGNNISNTQVPLQIQKGNDNAANNNNSSSPFGAGNEYFDRDNSSDACAEVASNIYTGNARLVTAPSTFVNALPPTNITNTDIAVKFCSIQSGIDYSRTTSGNTLQAVAGLYTEDVIVRKPLTILGPNSSINPCSGTRVPEAVVVPATEATNSGEVFHVAASNVTISGFTINGDNPSLTSGYLGINNADIDAAEGITIYEAGINNLTVTNNIIKNLSYFGVTLYGAAANTPTSGHVITGNKIQTMGTYAPASGIDRWGGGMLLYNNQYASITNNCIDSVRLGIQTGNFYSANPGSSVSQVIDGNTITHVRRSGVFHNLAYGSASPLTFSNNSITGTSNVNETKWDGVELASLSVPSTTSTNIIDATAVSQISSGIEVWNVAKTTPATIAGGTVTNATRGVFVNNYDGFTSDATFGANAAISAITINNAAADTGILVYDNPLSTHVKVSAAISAGVTINNGTHGLVLENDSAAISSMGNTAFVGQTGDYIRLIKTTSSFDATTATFGGLTGATASLAQNFTIEDKITHKIDSTILGFVTVKAANDFVTLNSYFAPSTAPSVQRGIDAASTGFTVNVADGVYNGDININKSVTLLGQSIAATIRGLYAGNPNTAIVSANNVTVKDVTITRDYGATLADWEASTKTQGLDAENLTGLILDHIVVKDNRNGMLIHSTPGFIIRNSTIRDNRTGIQLFGNLDNGQITNNFMNNNFTHAMVVNFDQGPTTGNNLLINNNDLSGNWYSQITFQNNSAPGTNVGSFTNFNANCNWYGSLFPVYNATNPTLPAYTAQTPSQFNGTDPLINSDIRGVEAALITYKPYLQDGTDNDLVAVGFQPVPGTCTSMPTKLYVNDGFVGTDVYTTASGNDATGLGTPASPFATIGRAVAGADAGDTIYVDGGTYRESVIVNKDHLDLRGVNFNIDPNTGSRITETIWQPAITNLDSAIVHISSVATSTKLNGFTLSGDNDQLTSGFSSLSADIDAGYGIMADNNVSSDTIKNNIITNIGVMGVSLSNANGVATTNNAIFENNFSNILLNNGIGVYLENNAYTIISKNVMTGVRIGVETGNFYNADPGNSHIIGRNKIQSQVLGIWTNLHYNNAANFIVRLDTITNYPGASTLQSIGIRVQSIQGNVGVTVLDNNITGNKYGIGLMNDPTTNTITVKGGTITGSTVGVWATNSFNTNNSNAAPSTYIVDSVNIQNTTYAGIEVTDTSLTTNGSSVSLAVTDYTTINNTTTGLLLQGKKASASFTGTTPIPALFTGQTKYIDQITNGTNVPGTNIDATAVSFDGALGSAMSLPTLYATEDKINHKIDSDSLGFILVKANNAYVTPISFIAPTTTFGKIQRGVNAASSGFTVNVKAGTYTENTTIGKALTILGAQSGQNANTRFGAFSALKANPSIESVVTAPTNNPTAGNPYANDLFRVVASNVVIDGFTFDGNNPTLSTSLTTDNTGLSIHARRAITNIDTTDNFNPVSSLIVRNSIMQNIAQRGVSLANNGPVSTGNSITGNVIRNFGWDPVNGGQAVILFTNAYADVTNNTIDVPTNQIGLHLQNFFTNGSMIWSGNNVTVGQDGIGIHANLFYPPTSTFTISGNTVNAATGVTGTSDYTWGINMWGVQNGSTVNITNNTVGSGGGTFARGINLWNLPTSNMVTVSGGTIAKSVVGVNLDNVDPYYGAGSTTLAKITGTTITASQSGVRARAAALATAPLFAANTVGGSVSLTLDNATIDVTGTTKAVEVNAPAASGSNMATVYLTNGTKINNNTTSDTAVLVNGNQAQLYAATSNIKIGTGTHDAIQFTNITSGNTVSNLILAGGTTINRNGNTFAKAFSSPQYSIVEMDGTGWTAPDSTAGGNQSVMIDGAMKFTTGILNAGNSTIEFGNEASDIITNSTNVVPEKATSYILGNAKMLPRLVGNTALDMLGLRLAAQSGAGADVGNMSVLRTTLASGAINPAFPGNNSIRTVWNITPSNPTSSRSDVEFRYLNTPTNLNGQTPSSIYSYRYSGGQWNKISATLSSAQVGDVYTTASFGVPGFSPWTLSSQSNVILPDLTSAVLTDGTTYDVSTPNRDNVIRITNRGTGATTDQIQFILFKLASDFTFTINPTATSVSVNGSTAVQNSSFTIVDMGGYYQFTSNPGVVIPVNGSIRVGFNAAKTGNAGAVGTISVIVLPGTGGGETPTTNNNNDTNISIN